MPRNQSFSRTKEQYRSQTKTVTRRLGWAFANEGDTVNGCEKIVVMGQHRFTNLRWEKLLRMCLDLEYGRQEVIKEGFPDMTPPEFVEMFCKANKCQPGVIVHRMEFEYVEEITLGNGTKIFVPVNVKRKADEIRINYETFLEAEGIDPSKLPKIDVPADFDDSELIRECPIVFGDPDLYYGLWPTKFNVEE